MSHNRIRIIYCALGFLAAVLFLFFSYSRVFDEFEYSTLDFRFRLRPPQPVDDAVVIVHVGDDTIEKLGDWPIPRSNHALLVKALESAGVKMIVFDIFFSEETKDDKRFAAAVAEAGNVYLPYIFEINLNAPDKRYVRAMRFIAPLVDALDEACKDSGFINVIPDIDGKVRQVIPFIEYKEKFYPNVSILAVLESLGFRFDECEIIPEKKIVVDKDFTIPLGEGSTLLVNYPARWGKAFRHYSYVDILESHLSGLMGQKGCIDLSELKDKVCFVGVVATASPDVYPSPLETLYPGIGVHASIYNSIVQRSFLERLNRWWNLLFLVILWLATIFITVKAPRKFAFLFIGLVFAAYAVITVSLFYFWGKWIDVAYPLVTAVGVYVIFTFRKYLVEAQKRELIERELDIARDIQESFLPKEIPQVEGLDIGARMLTARQVGGDLYDVIRLDEGKVGVMIGDVSGKGVPAALFMAQVVSVFKSFMKEKTASEVVRDVNNRLVSEGRSNLFVTFTYLVFDTGNKSLRFASGGHLPTLLIEPDGNIKLLTVEKGMPLGLVEGDFTEGALEYKPGSVFVLYTDGVTEAVNVKGDMFEEKGLVELAKRLKGSSAEAIVEAIHKSVAEYAGKAPQHDDITVVAIRT